MSSGQAMPTDREMAKTQAKTDLLLALYSHASDDLERTRAEADSLRHDLEMADRQLAEARKDVERVHRELNETRNERDRLTERNAQLQEQQDALLASASWRITAPIRAMTRVMKRQ